MDTFVSLAEDFTKTRSFCLELEGSSASAIRPLFFTIEALEAEALELRSASLALTLLYLASKSLVGLSSKRDAVFNETVFPFAEDSTKNFLSPLPTTFPCLSQASNYWEESSSDYVIPNNQNHASPTVNSNYNTTIQTPSITFTETSSLPTTTQTTHTILPSVQIPSSQSPLPLRRSNKTKTIPIKLQDFILTYTPKANLVSQTPLVSVFQDFVTALLVQKDPVNFKEDVAGPGWCAAMDVEL
ncbi:hypothetical protein Tco_1252979 [Tanacetum coccineum]